MHYDPYDVTRVWVRNHRGEGYIDGALAPAADDATTFRIDVWEHARKDRGRARRATHTEEAITAAVDDLLDRASPAAPSHLNVEKPPKIVALSPEPKPPPSCHPLFPTIRSGGAPIRWHRKRPVDDIADVVPLPVFDAEKEADTW